MLMLMWRVKVNWEVIPEQRASERSRIITPKQLFRHLCEMEIIAMGNIYCLQ